MGIQIGDVAVEAPFVLAPIAGVTNAAFRGICKAQGAGLVYSEMISGRGLLYQDKNTERLLKMGDAEQPVAYQIFGGQPDVVGAAARLLADRGNALLDINMGCPVPKIVKNGEGSALLKNPDLIGKIVRAAVAATKKPVTVKIRTGWDAPTINAARVAKIAEAAGAAAIAVHARTREQYYSGRADWGRILEVKQAVQIPVIGNGDVFSAEDAIRMLEETGCDAVMIARGALGNPWIFRDCLALLQGKEKPAPPTTPEKLAMLLFHFDALVAENGAHTAVREIRKHVGWYLKGVPHTAAIRRRANEILDADEFRALIESYRAADLR